VRLARLLFPPSPEPTARKGGGETLFFRFAVFYVAEEEEMRSGFNPLPLFFSAGCLFAFGKQKKHTKPFFPPSKQERREGGREESLASPLSFFASEVIFSPCMEILLSRGPHSSPHTIRPLFPSPSSLSQKIRRNTPISPFSPPFLFFLPLLFSFRAL